VFIGRMLAITPQQKVWLYACCKNVSTGKVNSLKRLYNESVSGSHKSWENKGRAFRLW
jgi:hypothetical protein